MKRNAIEKCPADAMQTSCRCLLRSAFPPSSSRRRYDLDRLARFHARLRAAGQDLDAAVVAADRIAAEFAWLAAHHAGAGNGAMAAENRHVHRPEKSDPAERAV